jgi:TatD DNase family protein
MIDVHCHMQFHAYKNDFDKVIKRAQENGVEIIINSSTSLESSANAVDLAEKYKNLFAIVGIHPHHADKVESNWDKELIKVAKSTRKVVGIGEIGLDYYSYSSNGIVDPQIQRDVFARQIEIANELNLPLQIHNRQAGNEILEIINEKLPIIRKKPPGMFHCMSGNVEFLKKVLDLGFFVGFDGNISYEGIAKGEDTPLPTLVKNTPIEKLVIETDAPFLTPIPYRGSRNEPTHAIIVGENIAKIKNLTKEEVEKITTKNAKKIFNLSFL